MKDKPWDLSHKVCWGSLALVPHPKLSPMKYKIKVQSFVCSVIHPVISYKASFMFDFPTFLIRIKCHEEFL